MKKSLTLILVLALAVSLGLAFPVSGQEKAKETGPFTIARAAVGTGVENSEPVGVAEAGADAGVDPVGAALCAVTRSGCSDAAAIHAPATRRVGILISGFLASDCYCRPGPGFGHRFGHRFGRRHPCPRNSRTAC